MKALAAGFLAGLVFAVGLGVSGMTKPSKVVGFFDVFGAWDASLAFVMVGAIGVYAVISRWITNRKSPLFERRFQLPARTDFDRRLLLGAGVFGVGWALGGYCPGPGIVALGSGSVSAVAFVVSMAVGVKLEHLFTARVRRARET